MKIGNFIEGQMDNLTGTYVPSIAVHQTNNRECAEKFNVDFFSLFILFEGIGVYPYFVWQTVFL